MTETNVLDLGIVKVTLAELSQDQIIRIAAQPVDLKMPEPPEGYNHEQAINLIASYKTEWDDYQATIASVVMLRQIGTARMLALDKGLVPESEKAALARVRRRYAFIDIDSSDDAYEIGAALFNIVNTFGDTTNIYESSLWLRLKAGFISDDKVSEILKSLRHPGERQADPVSSGEDQPQEQSQGQAKSHIVTPV